MGHAYDSLWFSNGNHTFRWLRTRFNSHVGNTEPWSFADIARFGSPADFNADGQADFLYVPPSGSSVSRGILKYSFAKLDLIASIANEIGVITEISYKLAVDTAAAIGNNKGSCLHWRRQGSWR